MSQTLEQDVKAYVAAKVANGDSFTAFDITDGMKVAAHRYVKPIVHQMFADGELGSYIREVDDNISGAPYRYSQPLGVTTGYASAPNLYPVPVAQVTGIAGPVGAQAVTTVPASLYDDPDYCEVCEGACTVGSPQRQNAPKANTASPAALVNSLIGNSPSTVAPTPAPTNSNAATALKAVAQSSITPVPVASPTGEDVSTNEGGTRLRVRKHTVVSAGFPAGTSLYATYSPNMKAVMLSTKPQSTNDPKATTAEVQVDVKQNVRLNLEKLGIQGNAFNSTSAQGLIMVNVQ